MQVHRIEQLEKHHLSRQPGPIQLDVQLRDPSPYDEPLALPYKYKSKQVHMLKVQNNKKKI